ncbi:MAG: TMEM165/GDT1 family protein [Desulfovibrio sp.]
MDWKLFLSAFGTLFLAELGDKTQLACVLMAARTEKPWAVFFGASLALVLVSFLGVMFAQLICNYVPQALIKKVAAIGFVVMGGLIWFDKL